MGIYRFITNSIWYFRRQHLAVFLATVIATASLTGALIIGDSVRHSLGSLVDARLGKTRVAVISGTRFMRAQLAKDLASSLHTPATPILMLRGIAIDPATGERINTAQILGIDTGFSFFAPVPLPPVGPGEALISSNVAQRLNLVKGDQFLLRIEKTGLIPVNVVYSRDERTSVALRLTVAGIAHDSTLGRFSLLNNQSVPYNIFISHAYLASQMQLDSLANLIIATGSSSDESLEGDVRDLIRKHWRLRDISLRITSAGEYGIFDLVSDRIFVDEPVSSLMSASGVTHEKIFTYLVNSFQHQEKQTPYSFVSAVSSTHDQQFPGDRAMFINRWLAEDLDAGMNDTLSLTYFVIGPWRNLTAQSAQFVVRGVIPNNGSLPARMLMPSIPGLSDAGSCRDWNSGVPVDLSLIRDKDEQYWNEYRGSPKAFIPLEAGQLLWKNQFGNCTAIRFNEAHIKADSLERLLLHKLDPRDFGIETIQVHREGKEAAQHSVDFSSLFLYLSFFIIAASVLLIILTYALNTEMRTHETALLAGLGFNRRQIIWLRLAESFPVIITGGLTGAIAGIAYNYFLLAGLNTIWQDAVNFNMLVVQIRPGTLILGAMAGTLLAFMSIVWISWRKLHNPVSGLLKQYPGSGQASSMSNMKVTGIIAILCTVLSLSLVAYSVLSAAFEHAGLFLTAGGLFLTGSVSFLAYILAKPKAGIEMNLIRLAMKNAGRKTGRSMAVIIILSLGVFSIMLTGAYRKTFVGSENPVNSGTGGYQLWVETSFPVVVNLNSEEGRKRLITENDSDLYGVHFFQFISLEGDDASCLNLNQVQKPRILGIPLQEFDARGAFSFARLVSGIDREHPWKALEKEYDSNIFPAFADQTVIHYGLKKSLGDTLVFLNEQGKPFRLILAGGLDNSVFQGNLLISDSVLRAQFPSTGGSRIMLVETPPAKMELISEVLKNSLPDYGVEITTATTRLAQFNSVENTYLTVFMMLGGLGLVIGTFGLGLVLLRNIMERRHELALLIALGYRKKLLARLIFTEYVFLLLAGVCCGSFSAFIAIMPSFLSPVFTLHPGYLISIILLIMLSGSLWIFVSARYILHQDLITALRED